MWNELKIDSVTTVYLHEDGDLEIEIDEGNGYYACKRSAFIKASVLSSWLKSVMVDSSNVPVKEIQKEVSMKSHWEETKEEARREEAKREGWQLG